VGIENGDGEGIDLLCREPYGELRYNQDGEDIEVENEDLKKWVMLFGVGGDIMRMTCMHYYTIHHTYHVLYLIVHVICMMK
jgi:hypothetical protein